MSRRSKPGTSAWRQDAPTETPAGHGVRLREAVEDDGAFGHALDRQDGVVLALVDEAPVDLVGQHHQVIGHGDRGDALKVLLREYRASRVVGAVEHEQASARGDQRPQLIEVDAEVVGGAQWDGDGHGAHEAGHRLIDGEARIRHDHLGAGFGQRQHRECHDGLGTGRDDDTVGTHLDTAAAAEVGRDGLAKRRDTERWGVVRVAIGKRAGGSLGDVLRCHEVGLTYVEADDVAPSRHQSRDTGTGLEGRFGAQMIHPLRDLHGQTLPADG